VLDVSRETLAKLHSLIELLSVWNARINLVGPGTSAEWWSRHVEDSLQLSAFLPDQPVPMADLGSGAGFPGLVLAVARLGPVHLVEVDQRKCAFLREATRTLALSHVTIHSTRIEDVVLPPLGAVTARALAPLHKLLGHASRLLAPDGIALFPKGRTAEAELTAAIPHWHMTTERFVSQTDPEATIFRIRDIRPA